MRLLILLSLVVSAVGVIIHENVVFQKVNEITSSVQDGWSHLCMTLNHFGIS